MDSNRNLMILSSMIMQPLTNQGMIWPSFLQGLWDAPCYSAILKDAALGHLLEHVLEILIRLRG